MTKETLKQTRPEVAITTSWEYDPHFEWDGDFPLDDGMEAHNVTVTATAIKNGEIYEGKAYLGGCYSLNNGEDDPEIGGYLPQMIEEALAELDFNMA